jgi:hypothetical protein
MIRLQPAMVCRSGVTGEHRLTTALQYLPVHKGPLSNWSWEVK